MSHGNYRYKTQTAGTTSDIQTVLGEGAPGSQKPLKMCYSSTSIVGRVETQSGARSTVSAATSLPTLDVLVVTHEYPLLIIEMEDERFIPQSDHEEDYMVRRGIHLARRLRFHLAYGS